MKPLPVKLNLFWIVFIVWTVGPSNEGTAGGIVATMDEEDPLKKIMILFLGSNYEKRQTVESEITYYINDAGYEAQQSYKFFTETDLPETDLIVETLEKNGFDGILVIEILDVDLKKERVNARMTYGGGPGTPFLFDYFSVYRRYSEGYERIDMTFVLQTMLFRLADKSLIYSNETQAYEKGDIDLALEEFAKKTARNLKKSKTLLKTK